MSTQDFLNACKTSDCETISRLLKVVDVNVTDNYNRTGLHFAAEAGSLEMIKLLLKHGADTVIFDKLTNCTPIMIAYRRRHVHVLRELATIN